MNQKQMSSEANVEPPDVVCGGCHCWCDDPSDDGNPPWSDCPVGRSWAHQKQAALIQLAAGDGGDRQSISSSDLEDVMQRLLQARQPAVFGLTELDIDAQRYAVGIADQIQAFLDPCLSPASRAKTIAMQQVGSISCTWGEVRHRAQGIIYWDCDFHQAPRFRQRYGDLGTRCFERASATSWLLGETVSSDGAEGIAVDITGDQLLEELLEPSLRSDVTHQLVKQWESLDFVAWVIGSPIQPTSQAQLQLRYERLYRWMVRQSERQRIVSIPWPGSGPGGNSTGIQSVMAWRTGYPMAVKFQPAGPSYDPHGYGWQQVLKRRETDLVLWLGRMPGEAVQLLAQSLNPQQVIQLSPVADLPGSLHLSTAGVPDADQRCLIQRPDGMMLPSRWTVDRSETYLKALLKQIIAFRKSEGTPSVLGGKTSVSVE